MIKSHITSPPRKTIVAKRKSFSDIQYVTIIENRMEPLPRGTLKEFVRKIQIFIACIWLIGTNTKRYPWITSSNMNPILWVFNCKINVAYYNNSNGASSYIATFEVVKSQVILQLSKWLEVSN